MSSPRKGATIGQVGRTVWAGLVLTAALASAAPAATDDKAQCAGAASADDKIKACTAVIQSRRSPCDRADAHNRRGIGYHEKGDYGRAIADFDHMIRLQPDNAVAFVNRCQYRIVANRLQDAIKDCTRSLELRPNHPDGLEVRGFVYLRMEKFERAIKLGARLERVRQGLQLADEDRPFEVMHVVGGPRQIQDFARCISWQRPPFFLAAEHDS